MDFPDFTYSTPTTGAPSFPVSGTDPMSSGFDIFGKKINPRDAKKWWDLSQDVVDAWEGIYAAAGGGSSPWGSSYDNNPFDVCPLTPNFDAVARWTLEAPEADIAEVVRYLREGNRDNGPQSRAELAEPQWLPNWVKALMGGKDCRASTFPAAPAMFTASVLEYGGPGIQEANIFEDWGVEVGAMQPMEWGLAAAGLGVAYLIARKFF